MSKMPGMLGILASAFANFLTQKQELIKTGGHIGSGIHQRFAHRGEKRRYAFRHGMGKGWSK